MIRRTLLISAMLSAAAVTGAAAQEAAAAKGLDIELNALAASQKGCLFTFVAGNGFAQDVSKVSFEFVIFNDKGTVERLALLDFRELPAGKSKVRQFDVPGIKCETVKNLLINDAPVCEGEGLEKGRCMDGIVTRSKASAGLDG
ncbi:hypothetical protein MNR02_04240 [Shinella sp. H4-D48]|uniref:Tat pathway signal sequence domain protein n=1 Tax=Shinella sedimenti TaxID=2919913 RepID=A0ABT0CQ26_9HYPH|nr:MULTISPECIES: hypothetical protein [Shinella]MCJ8150707.1 hypothetical protein [Shinella sedimenti]UNK38922.1 hypothetical protein MNR02_04240 [Shinella sp. H4-D48]